MPVLFARPIPQPTQNLMGGALPGDMTLTRAGTGWAINSAGVLTAYAADQPRFDYDPTALVLKGLRNEPSAINTLRNASWTGAANGTPGTAPTNWSVTTTANNVVRTISNVGTTEDGFVCADVAYAGTPSVSGSASVTFETNTQVAALNGQTWTASAWLRLMLGSYANLNTTTPLTPLSFGMNMRNSGGSAIGSAFASNFGPTTAALRTQRCDVTATLNNASTAFLTSRLSFNYTINQPINFTLRIGLPQLVQAADASSPIVTTAGAVTRPADVVTITGLSGMHDIWVSRVRGITSHSRVDLSGGSFIIPTNPSRLMSALVKP